LGMLKTFGVKEGEGLYHEEAIYSLALIYNLVHNRVAQYLKPYNLTPGKFNVLVAIEHHGADQGIPQVDVSKHLIVTPSNMTKLIDKLEKEKLVKRFRLKGDRRVNITKITPQGKQLINDIWDGYKAVLKTFSCHVNQNDQKILADISKGWLEQLLAGKTNVN